MHTHINSRSWKGEYLQKYNNNNNNNNNNNKEAKVADELNQSNENIHTTRETNVRIT
jgi:hypothetical protein